MDKKREQLLSDGYVILRQVVPPELLSGLRRDIEAVVERQRANDPEWKTASQPRASIVDYVDADTIGAFAFVLHENTYGVSVELLDRPKEAVSATGAFVICNPESTPGEPQRPGQSWGTDPRNWHRDVRPDRDAPLGALLRDQQANGPAYVQWNIAFYEDHVFYVVPGSHRRLTTQTEASHLRRERGTLTPVPESCCIELGPGDGAVYNNVILHWGSRYVAEEKRRSIHLGYRSFGRIFPCQECYLPWGFWNRFAESTPQRRVAESWLALSRDEFATIEREFRAALAGDREMFLAGLATLHPPQEGRLTCLILLSKLVLAAHQQARLRGGNTAGARAGQARPGLPGANDRL